MIELRWIVPERTTIEDIVIPTHCPIMGWEITQIRDFTPDDTPDKFYIEGSSDIETIIEQAMKKWPQTNHQLNLDRLRITSEYIHTHCLGYDLYDPGDYTNYLCIELVKEPT